MIRDLRFDAAHSSPKNDHQKTNKPRFEMVDFETVSLEQED